MLKNKSYVYGDAYFGYLPDYIHLGKLFLHKFWTYKDQIAIINAETDERLTYGEIAQRAVDTALSLARLGVKRGDVVSICSEKRLEFMPTLLGIVCSGATFAPADITCGRATMLHRVNLVKSKVMFISPKGYETQKDTLKSVDSIQKFILFGDTPQEGAILFKDFLTETAKVEDFTPPPTRGCDEYAVILYSSGTTGLPKAIPLTHRNFILFTANIVDEKFYKNKTVLNTREWYYSYGMSFSLGCLHHGATVVYSPRNQCEDFLEAIQKYQIPPEWSCAAESKLVEIHHYGRSKNEYTIIKKEMEKTKVYHPRYNFKEYNIIKIEKILNGCLWKQYIHQQREVILEAGYANQRMLFHGSSVVDDIARRGFNEQYSNLNGMFGAGLYFAEHSSKANQYAFSSAKAGGCPEHHDYNCDKCERKMLLCRVTLGRSKREYEVMKYPHPPWGYNSVVGTPSDKPKGLKYAEYIVYKREQAYPEYVITYKTSN